jgi:ABC-type Fe3+ transport system substrate-binding protein
MVSLDRRRLCASLGSASIVLASRGVLAQTSYPSLLSKARAEGSVVWYTDLVVDQVVRPIAALFKSTYGIELRFNRADSQQTILKILDEHGANRPAADVFSITNGMQTLIEASAAAKFEAPNATMLPAGYRDPQSQWLTTTVYAMTPAVNTDLVPAAARPKTYEDLLHPRWAGKIAWKPNDVAGAPGFIGNILITMGEERGMQYLRRLSGQKIKIVDSSSRGLIDQVVAGTYPMVLQIANHHSAISAKQGAPVDWLPFSPSAIVLDTAGMVSHCPHPNAAQLLLNFLVSTEAQGIFAKADYLPANPKVPAFDPTLSPEGGRFKGTLLTPELIAKNLAHWNEIFSSLFRSR